MARTEDDLFADASLETTARVARAVGISEHDAREFAWELDVGKFGSSYAWTEEDVMRLRDELEGEEDDEEAEAAEEAADEDDDLDDEELDEDEEDDEDLADDDFED